MRRVWEVATAVLASITGLGASTYLLGIPSSFPVFVLQSLVILAICATTAFGGLVLLR